MLPSNPRGTVYINPNFKTTHINPKFLRGSVPNSIHINPAFLDKQVKTSTDNINTLPLEELLPNQIDYIPNCSSQVKETEAKIIPKSRTKLIRTVNLTSSFHKKMSKFTENEGLLMKIGLRKLIRSSPSAKAQSVNIFTKQNTRELTINFSKINNVNSNNLKAPRQKYKIDHRVVIKPTTFLNGVKKKTFVSQFALNRNSMILSPKNVIVAQKQFIKKMLPKGTTNSSSNLKLELLNINGVLYKSTRTKLQRSVTDQKQNIKPKSLFPSSNKKSNGDRVLFVRGNKFVLDKSGLKLTKIQAKNSSIAVNETIKNTMKRIDIGGLTYVAKSNNVFVRTDIHVTRNYLSTTKQRSINTLHNRKVKTNIPCPIYRKLGKCIAYEKGKCPKLHEKKQIAICPMFLKGECSKINCLLSHNVNFSKMPICKFFLQSCCVREDCPYLHKKLGKTVEICPEFLKGFCNLAEKCPKRHEFLCPDFESRGNCEKVNCIYCKKRIKENLVKEFKLVKIIEQKRNVRDTYLENNEISKENEASRYFVEKSKNEELNCTKLENIDVSESLTNASDDSIDIDDEKNLGSTVLKRPKLGILPAFIPL